MYQTRPVSQQLAVFRGIGNHATPLGSSKTAQAGPQRIWPSLGTGSRRRGSRTPWHSWNLLLRRQCATAWRAPAAMATYPGSRSGIVAREVRSFTYRTGVMARRSRSESVDGFQATALSPDCAERCTRDHHPPVVEPVEHATTTSSRRTRSRIPSSMPGRICAVYAPPRVGTLSRRGCAATWS